MSKKYAFGPVPSRRLGRSLGINNIPFKYCTYSCIYCQLGLTRHKIITRREFFPWRDIVADVLRRIKEIGDDNIDYITFVPDGEPTLDINLGREIDLLKENTSISIAVITNASLLFNDDVRNDLMIADLVSVKIDAISPTIFRTINRPHHALVHEEILDGIQIFSKDFRGKLITETMLVSSVNDNATEIEKIAKYIRLINPSKAYIAIPIRPPTESWVKPPTEERILEAYNIFQRYLGTRVELLIGYEDENFGVGKDPISDLLAIVSVHPMKLDYAYKLLQKAGLDPCKVLEKLIKDDKIRIIKYKDSEFILRKFKDITK